MRYSEFKVINYGDSEYHYDICPQASGDRVFGKPVFHSKKTIFFQNYFLKLPDDRACQVGHRNLFFIYTNVFLKDE